MKSIEDVSYGVIPYSSNQDNKIEFFLIYQYSSLKKDIYWVFPKGHAEEGETSEETAIRELKEETNLSIAKLNTKETFKTEHEFIHDGVNIKKKTIFFLGEVISKSYFLQEDEVKDAGWFSYEEALEKLTYNNHKALLRKAFVYIGK